MEGEFLVQSFGSFYTRSAYAEHTTSGASHTIATFYGHNSRRQKQEINLVLLGLNLLTHCVNVSKLRHIRLDEVDLALRIEGLELLLEQIGLLLAASYKIYSWFDSVAHEFSSSAFSYAASPSDY